MGCMAAGAQRLTEHMTIVQTAIPTPEASQNFTYVGVFG